jgi:hypothetical protein
VHSLRLQANCVLGYFVFNDNNPLEERNLVREEGLIGRVCNHVVNEFESNPSKNVSHEVRSNLQGGRHSWRSLSYRGCLRVRPVGRGCLGGRGPIVEHPTFTT